MSRGRFDPAARALGAAVDRVFDEGGALARAVPEFEPRPGQRAMAAAVADAIEQGHVLLAEAGTGTGKTLAYLVPAILSGRRVLVSTGTKTLQEQIFTKDLPLLQASLDIPFKATYMKGRGNYLCLHRLDQFRDNPMAMAFADADTMAAIGDWAERTETGDRAELEDLPEDLSIWSDSRPRRRAASARRARATRTASSRGCASAPPNPTSSSSTTTCCAPTRRSGRTPTAR